MKKILMIMGSNAAGKTSQSKLLHQNLNNTNKKEIKVLEFINKLDEPDQSYITLYDRTAHVGKVEDNQCTGTDTLGTRDKIEFSFLSSLFYTNVELVVIDGIMTTSTWSEMIHQAREWCQMETILVLLQYKDVEANYARIRQRRANKTGQSAESIELSEKTQDNIFSKYKGFKSMYERIKYDFNVYAEIDADLPMEQIHRQILQLINL